MVTSNWFRPKMYIFFWWINIFIKGQLISKWFLGSTIFSKNTSEQIHLFNYDWLVFVCFLEEIDDPKSHFEINWPLGLAISEDTRWALL